MMSTFLRWMRFTRSDPQADSRTHAVCPQCGSDAMLLVSSTDRNRHTTSDVFNYFRCGCCGLVFMDPIPSDLKPFYRGGYREMPTSFADLELFADAEAYRLKPLLALKRSGRLLEIGPWMGVFSLNAKRAGFDVSAIEMDPGCVNFLQRTVGVRALQSDDPVTTLSNLNESFDVIVLWHCLEHLREPWKVIRCAAETLAPGGMLLVAIPNIESYEFSVLHAAWRNLDAPRHLYFFPPASLDAVCAGCGLTRLSLTTTDELSEAFSAETWEQIARTLVPVRYVRGLARRTMKAVANRRERRYESGPNITAVYQRPE